RRHEAAPRHRACHHRPARGRDLRRAHRRPRSGDDVEDLRSPPRRSRGDRRHRDRDLVGRGGAARLLPARRHALRRRPPLRRAVCGHGGRARPRRPPVRPRRARGAPVIRLVGAAALAIARETGGIVLLLGRVLRSLVPPSVDGRELVRNLHKMGNQSVPIVALTAFFTGGVMLVQTGIFVRRFGATGLVGWAAGYSIFREVGPILIGLMFSGRVGAHNTAELGTMTVTEQLDGLRALAIDPTRYLIVPRVVAMMVTLLCLTAVGDLVAIAGAALFAKLLLGIEWGTFFGSF